MTIHQVQLKYFDEKKGIKANVMLEIRTVFFRKSYEVPLFKVPVVVSDFEF